MAAEKIKSAKGSRHPDESRDLVQQAEIPAFAGMTNWSWMTNCVLLIQNVLDSVQLAFFGLIFLRMFKAPER